MQVNESGYQDFPSYTTKSRNTSRFFLLFIIFLLLVAGILAGLFFLGFSKRDAGLAITSPKVTATEEPLPTSSTSAAMFNISVSPGSTGGELSTVDRKTKLNRGELKVAVLNGSGEPGAAGGVSSYLKELGYNIGSVGNADVFTYRNLTVMVKSGKSSYAALLKKDLQANPSFASVSASINNSISADAEVIVGK
jgi:hypothetical protein